MTAQAPQGPAQPPALTEGPESGAGSREGALRAVTHRLCPYRHCGCCTTCHQIWPCATERARAAAQIGNQP